MSSSKTGRSKSSSDDYYAELSDELKMISEAGEISFFMSS